MAETPPPSAEAKPRSTVPDVVYDEHGQTWDVYGAEFDPLILGQAIQSYLEKIMARTIMARKTMVRKIMARKIIARKIMAKYIMARKIRVRKIMARKIMARKIQAAAAAAGKNRQLPAQPSWEKLTVNETGSKDDVDQDGSRPRLRLWPKDREYVAETLPEVRPKDRQAIGQGQDRQIVARRPINVVETPLPLITDERSINMVTNYLKRPKDRRRDGSRPRQRDRALSFVMRYLCTSLWRQGRT